LIAKSFSATLATEASMVPVFAVMLDMSVFTENVLEALSTRSF
jgi:hypothetical protein